jgi:hypothetical protein
MEGTVLRGVTLSRRDRGLARPCSPPHLLQACPPQGRAASAFPFYAFHSPSYLFMLFSALCAAGRGRRAAPSSHLARPPNMQPGGYMA